ncbi:MAG: sigma-54-dependent Fis family transcriptional regulator [Lentisphaerae bacterium]|nr:MAG: sigma-54-dependent Fis family transcriptional regulator [Lentisphaerota bacterium]
MNAAKRNAPQILAVDDDPVCRSMLERILKKIGVICFCFDNGVQAIDFLANEQPHLDMIFLDVVMPELDGFQLFEKLRQFPKYNSTPVIFITALTDQEAIQKCFLIGGNDYIAKPIRDTELLARFKLHHDLLKHREEVGELERENQDLRKRLLTGQLEKPEKFRRILTRSTQMQAIFQYVESISKTSRPVFITGETGTGKELIAQVIHELSERKGKFVPLNVAGLDDNLFSDTLFGHVKGAFTGAVSDRSGLIEEAANGTLFLDEIGDLDMLSQVKLLRLLQEGEYYPLGSDSRKYSNARIVVATHQNIPKLVEKGKFRKDLYYRLRTHHVHIPPLRQRKCDLEILVRHFVTQAAQTLNRKPPKIPDGLIELLEKYSFPGNIRELEGIVFDAVSCARKDILDIEMFRYALAKHAEDERFFHTVEDDRSVTSHPSEPGGYPSPHSRSLLDQFVNDRFPTLKEITEQIVQEALQRTNGNQAEAAKLLGITRQALNKRLKKYREQHN